MCLTSHVHNMTFVELGCGTSSRDQADHQRGHVKFDDVADGGIRWAGPLARRVRRLPRGTATAHNARLDSGAAVPAGSIVQPTVAARRSKEHRSACPQGLRRVTETRVCRDARPTNTDTRSSPPAMCTGSIISGRRSQEQFDANNPCADSERLRASLTSFAAANRAVSPVRTVHLSHPPNQRHCRLEPSSTGVNSADREYARLAGPIPECMGH